eukprot:361579-Chlamydomonas_euryale.AAC.7
MATMPACMAKACDAPQQCALDTSASAEGTHCLYAAFAKTRHPPDDTAVVNTCCSKTLTAEVAKVLGVLRHLHLLDNLTQRRAVARAVFADDSDLLCALGLRTSP